MLYNVHVITAMRIVVISMFGFGPAPLKNESQTSGHLCFGAFAGCRYVRTRDPVARDRRRPGALKSCEHPVCEFRYTFSVDPLCGSACRNPGVPSIGHVRFPMDIVYPRAKVNIAHA